MIDVCRTGDSFNWQMGAWGSTQYRETIRELTPVRFTSPEDLNQPVKNPKTIEVSVIAKTRKKQCYLNVLNHQYIVKK